MPEPELYEGKRRCKSQQSMHLSFLNINANYETYFML